MGFTSGFTGGVALTLSVTYLSVLAHQRNRERQGALLRAQALQLQSIIDPLPAALPPTRSEFAAAQRATTIEVAKDRWNHEVERAVRWAQTTDWDDVRSGIESTIETLWSRASGQAPAQPAGIPELERAGKAARRLGRDAEETARSAYVEAKRQARSVEQAAENKLLEARLRANRAETAVVEAGKDLIGRAKAAVVGDGDGDNATPEGPTPVQIALRQRFEKPADAAKPKTVAEALRERYIPLDQWEGNVLRGL
ncbi:altered inheritance of mitochondria protein 5 [Geosmithia morbida]|uniref:MICOS complex subunit MIC12 n=1 Tax=Geosmithia morbida TaxID=1094350 RepID=A0A9P4Z452_9HYPO|nr:altered inheritance of mitochondria protein 5 [Geosmithia morbida]KAF4126299.1 altered inheritance of mitochondria protein 5 [Geosmithia morbida]